MCPGAPSKKAFAFDFPRAFRWPRARIPREIYRRAPSAGPSRALRGLAARARLRRGRRLETP
eukprot:9489732-Pyramimonas_sp.AAC.1